jgi:hypothetical protein
MIKFHLVSFSYFPGAAFGSVEHLQKLLIKVEIISKKLYILRVNLS